jgi:hypothetical protein
MNHSINDKSEKSLSVSPIFDGGDRELFYASQKDFDNDVNGEHIYENVPKKRKSLSELMINLRMKSRELSLRRYARRLRPKMIENRRNAVHEAFFDDESSYTSCNEENIYENLDFGVDESVEVENYSLKSWLHSLSMEVEDYADNGDLMIAKCIPSKQTATCGYGDYHRAPRDVTVTHATSELDKFKLDVLRKCFSAVWWQESENEILGGLYVFLNEVFATYFRKSRAAVSERMETREGADDAVHCGRVDKKTVQRLETFILSSTLNRATITYNRSLKFYFALESSQCLVGVDLNSVLRVARCYVGHNCLKNKNDLRTFLKTLRLILVNRYQEINRVKAIKSTDDVESTSVIEENIYEPIWDCVNRYENIYEPVSFKAVDDNDYWVVDAEFSYFPKLPSSGNMFKTVQIIHRVNSDSVEKISQIEENDAVLNDVNQSSDFGESKSVRAWKELLRGPFYNEDEEEFVRTHRKLVESITNFVFV